MIDKYLFQDAHEFLIFLINHINEIIVGEQGGGNGPGNPAKNRSLDSESEAGPTWINEIFQVLRHRSTNDDLLT